MKVAHEAKLVRSKVNVIRVSLAFRKNRLKQKFRCVKPSDADWIKFCTVMEIEGIRWIMSKKDIGG